MLHLSLWNALFALVPTNLMSFLTGACSRLKFPHFIQQFLNFAFVKFFKIDMSEAALPLWAFSSIEEIFVRQLKPGMRPVTSPVVSPADGFLARSGAMKDGDLIQAKGIHYQASELVGRPGLPSKGAAWFTTVYLAPHNYHRVHAPIAGKLKLARYIPGQLWPVNQPFVRAMPRLFSRNERVVFEIEAPEGGILYAIMVGALNVGRMMIAARPDFISNSLSSQFMVGCRPQEIPLDVQVQAGDELGTFMLGSTVVLIFDELLSGRYRFVQRSENSPITMGQSLIQEL